MEEKVPPEVIDAIVDKIIDNNLNCSWKATTPEEALEEAFLQPQMIALFGEISVETTLEEIAYKTGAIDFANKVLAEKENTSPQKEVFYSYWAKRYAEHIESQRNLSHDRAEYQATVAYDAVCRGLKPTIRWFSSVLVDATIINWDIEKRQNVIRYAVKNALTFKCLLDTVTYGFVIAHKIGELQNRICFAEMLITQPTHQQQYTTFESLFKSEYRPYINDFIQLLREVTPAIINDEGGYIEGKTNKGIFVVFWKALKEKTLVFSNPPRKTIAAIFNQQFPGLDISESLFSHGNQKANETYFSSFKADLAAIKARIKEKH